MFQGINPKMLKQAMKQMGIKQEELDASEVIIKLKDKNITIAQPSVLKVNMSGQESFQISGNIIETSKELFTNEDVFHAMATEQRDTSYVAMDVLDVGLDQILECEELIDRLNNEIEGVSDSEKVKKFEDEFAGYCGSKFAIGTGNGLDALTLIFRAYKEIGVFKEGDEIIVPANTYIASILAVTENRLKPVLAEPDIGTYNIDIGRLEEKITG